jgi:ABC-2 type transport system permease protein
MMRAIRAWPTLWRIGVAEMVAYRAEMIIWILSATLPLVMLSLWNAASEGGPLGGVSQIAFARYFTVTLVVRQLTGAWVFWELNFAVRTGSLSPALLKPVNPLYYNLATTLAAIPWRMMVLAPILVGLFVWRPEIAFVPTLSSAAAFVISVSLAWLLSWLIQCLFGILAFWFDQTMGLFSVYFAVWAFLSGYVVPLPLLPDTFRTVVRYLPFHGTLGAPVDILTGMDAAPWATIGLQAAWTALGLLAVVAAWSRGVRRFGAVGA